MVSSGLSMRPNIQRGMIRTMGTTRRRTETNAAEMPVMEEKE